METCVECGSEIGPEVEDRYAEDQTCSYGCWIAAGLRASDHPEDV